MSAERSQLIKQLEREGHYVAADQVRHGYLPGNTNASLPDMLAHYEGLEMETPARIIRNFLQHSEREQVAERVDEAGWPAVADDIRSGTDLDTVRRRCRETLSENECEALLGTGGVL